MGFSRQESWSGLPCPSPGNLPDPGIEPGSPARQVESLPRSHQGRPDKPDERPGAKLLQSCPTLCDPTDYPTDEPARLLGPGDSLGKNTGVGCPALLQGLFLTQGSNLRLLRFLHWQEGHQ